MYLICSNIGSKLESVSHLLEYVTGQLDQKRHVVAVYIDLKKAFDNVDIQLLFSIWKASKNILRT